MEKRRKLHLFHDTGNVEFKPRIGMRIGIEILESGALRIYAKPTRLQDVRYIEELAYYVSGNWFHYYWYEA